MGIKGPDRLTESSGSLSVAVNTVLYYHVHCDTVIMSKWRECWKLQTARR